MFDQFARADAFVFYDDVQYDKRGWRNRNQIKTASGKQWLTIPVESRGAQTEGIPINAIRIVRDRPWRRQHLGALRHAYGKAPYFRQYLPLIERIYQRDDELLADFTIAVTLELADELGIRRPQVLRSSELGVEGQKTDRLINVLKAIGADHYISGPSAESYIETDKFAACGIDLEYMSYDYPEYPQLYPPYDPHVSLLDLLFMTGPRALDYINRSPE